MYYADVFDGHVVFGLAQAQPLHQSHPTLHPSKDSVFTIQPRRRRQGDEKLAAVCIRSCIGHGKNTSASVLERGADLVLEFLAVDALAAAAGACWVSSLNHKTRNYTVEDCVVVIVSICESGEVVAGLGMRLMHGCALGSGDVGLPWAHVRCRVLQLQDPRLSGEVRSVPLLMLMPLLLLMSNYFWLFGWKVDLIRASSTC